MRDKFRDLEYFERFLAKEKYIIDKFQTMLDNNELKPDRILPVKDTQNFSRIQILIANYSIGSELSLLKPMYAEILEKMQKVWRNGYYFEYVDLMALGILLNMDKEMKEAFSPIFSGRDDIDWMLGYMLYGPNNYKIRFPHAFKFMHEIVEAKPEVRPALLKHYIEREWYRANNQQAWHNSHKSKQDVFYGYWSFEAGAIAKLLNIDDHELKDSKYYPYDLVHFKG